MILDDLQWQYFLGYKSTLKMNKFVMVLMALLALMAMVAMVDLVALVALMALVKVHL